MVLIKWDWSFFIIPILMALSISLTNAGLIAIRRKRLGILLHLLLSIALFFVMIGVTFGLSSWTGNHEVFYIGCVLGGISFALITHIILPFPKLWLSMTLVAVLSILAFPISTYIHVKHGIFTDFLIGRENISIVWGTFVGFANAIGIHYGRHVHEPLNN